MATVRGDVSHYAVWGLRRSSRQPRSPGCRLNDFPGLRYVLAFKATLLGRRRVSQGRAESCPVQLPRSQARQRVGA